MFSLLALVGAVVGAVAAVVLVVGFAISLVDQ